MPRGHGTALTHGTLPTSRRAVSLFTFALVICLFFSEIVWYRTTRVENHLLVDTSQVRSAVQ